MSAPAGLTYAEFKALQPCEDSLKRIAKLFGGARKWNGRKVSASEARSAGVTFDDIVWAASAIARKDADIERRLRLWMADCAARVLHIYEKTGDSDAPRNAIVASRQFARGEIDDAARVAARAAAGDAARAAAGDAARVAAWAAAGVATWAAWDAEEQWQFDRLIERLEGEPEDWPLPEPCK